MKILAYVGKLGSGKTFLTNKFIDEIYRQEARPCKFDPSSFDRIYDDGLPEYNGPKTFVKLAYADGIKEILRDLGLTKEGILFRNSWQFPIEKVVADAFLEKFTRGLSLLKFGAVYSRTKNEFEALVRNPYTIDGAYSTGFRKLMNLLGTQIGRELSQSVWIDYMHERIWEAKKNGYECAVIDDLRFLNEYEELVKYFDNDAYDFQVLGVVCSDATRMRRRGITDPKILEMMNSHQSEAEVDEILKRVPVVHNEDEN